MIHLPDSSEEIAPMVTLEWYANRRIVGYTVRSVARASIDPYGKRMLNILEEWSPDRTYLTVQDFADPSISFTPLLRHYVDKVGVARLDVAHYTALIMPKTFISQFAKTFILLANKPGKVESKVFFSREEGLDWLWEKLPGAKERSKSIADADHS